jgi:hypothetical protein
MTFPSGTSIATTNVDSIDDDPSLARVDIYNLIVAFNSLIASENLANGVAVLNGSGKLAASLLPATMNITGNIQLQPSTGIVNIRNVLRLYQIATTDLGITLGTAAPAAGDMCFLTDGDAGTPCLSVYDGTKWRIVRLMTEVGDVGATITATSTLTATAVV